MSGLSDANNAVARLIQAGQWAEAERELGEIERVLQGRPEVNIRVPPRTLDLAAAMDEFFAASHRVLIGWYHERYEKTLPFAERAWRLEKAIFAAGRTRREGKERFATSIGAWGYISFLSRSGRFHEAAAVFWEVIDDRDWFWACFNDVGNDHKAKIDLLLAGIEVYLESEDPALIERGRVPVAFAQDHRTVTDTLFLQRLAQFWCMTDWSDSDDRDRAFSAIEQAIERGYDREDFLFDPRLARLHEDPRWQRTLLPEPLRVVPDGPEPWYHFTEVAWTPDEAARAKTRAFLGNHRGGWIRIDFGATMFAGPGTVKVLGNGHATLHRFPRHLDEPQSLQIQFKPADVERLFDAFVAEAFTEMSFPAAAFARPGDPRVEVELGNASSDKHCVERFSYQGNEGFDRLLETIDTITQKYLAPDQYADFLAPFGRRFLQP